MPSCWVPYCSLVSCLNSETFFVVGKNLYSETWSEQSSKMRQVGQWAHGQVSLQAPESRHSKNRKSDTCSMISWSLLCYPTAPFWSVICKSGAMQVHVKAGCKILVRQFVMIGSTGLWLLLGRRLCFADRCCYHSSLFWGVVVGQKNGHQQYASPGQAKRLQPVAWCFLAPAGCYC